MKDIELIKQRLQKLEDKQAILELKHKYLNACDEKRPELVNSCFIEGEVNIDYGHIGQFSTREDFVDIFKKLGCHDHIIDMHHAQNPTFLALSETHAKAKINLYFQSINTKEKTQLQLGGFYLDEFEKQSNGEWLITKSKFNINSVKISDFSGEHSKLIYSGNTMPSSD